MPNSTAVEALDQAILNHPSWPRGVKVGPELWAALVAAERIDWKPAYILGIIETEIEIPVLNNNIFIHPSLDLSEHGYELPNELP